MDIRYLNTVLNKLIRDKQPPEVVDATRRQLENAATVAVVENPEFKSTSSEPMEIVELLEKEIIGLDVSRGLERYGGEGKLYLKLLSSYVTTIRSMLNTIEVVSKATLAEYKITVHGIKGASNDVFVPGIAIAAGKLENAAASGDFNYVEKHNHEFVVNTKEFIEVLDEMLKAADTKTLKPSKHTIDDEMLSDLFEACKSYHIDSVDAAMAEIDKYQYDSDDGLAGWLRENVDMMNLSEIAEKLSLIIGGNHPC
jgi:hypothetical protein